MLDELLGISAAAERLCAHCWTSLSSLHSVTGHSRLSSCRMRRLSSDAALLYEPCMLSPQLQMPQAVAEGPRATDAFSAVAAACVAGVGALADTQEVTQLGVSFKPLNIAHNNLQCPCLLAACTE